MEIPEDEPGVVYWVYDNEIEDTMEEVCKALKDIGINVTVDIKRCFPPERVDFEFKRVP
jgi:hypothetical protein